MDVDFFVLLANLDNDWTLAVRLPEVNKSVIMWLQSQTPSHLQLPLLRRDGRHVELRQLRVWCSRFRRRGLEKRGIGVEKKG